jgi:hypothetical protein
LPGSAGEFTLPAMIAIELRRIRFFAPATVIQAGLGMPGVDPVTVFTKLRERKTGCELRHDHRSSHRPERRRIIRLLICSIRGRFF